MQDLRILSIASGAFTANGNFSGYTLKGERVHFFSRQLKAAFGDEEPSFPFPCLAQSKSYQWDEERDEQGNVTRKAGSIDNRLTAMAAFVSEDAMADALAADEGLAARVESKKAKRVKALMADLDPAEATA
jgi:hypothetical protein